MIYDTTPRTHCLNALRSAKLGTALALAELYDNAIDHEANEIRTTIDRASIRVDDNGTGIRDISSLISFGHHNTGHARGKYRLGRYGVGGTEALVFLADEVEIETVHNGAYVRLGANFRQLEASGSWQLEGPDPVPVDKPSRSSIIMRKLIRTVPRGRQQQFGRLVDELSRIFMPAQSLGIRILINGRLLTEPRLPDCAEMLRATIPCMGKSVTVEAGVVRTGIPNPWRGLWYTYGHRAILHGTALGLGHVSSSLIAGKVELPEDWPLTKNKDGIRYDQELGEAVQTALKPVLEFAEKQSVQISSEKLRAELRGDINAMLSPVKSKRRPRGDSTGTVVRLDSGRKQQRVRRYGSGDKTLERIRQGGGLDIDFLDYDDDRLGEYDQAARRVKLNTSIPLIAEAKGSANKSALTVAIGAILGSWGATSDDGQQLFRFAIDTAPERMIGRVISHIGFPAGESADGCVESRSA